MEQHTLFSQEVVECPNCSHIFAHNVVNGLALIDTVNKVDARKRMYCRLFLNDVERLMKSDDLTFPELKKMILDNFNDFNRDIQVILGFGGEVE